MSSLPPPPSDARNRALELKMALPGGSSFIPVFGLGTWMGREAVDKTISNAVKISLIEGYRHIDTAAIYNDEDEVGEGIKSSGIPRDEIFITTKLWNSDHRPEDVLPALEKSLKKLQVEYIDLYLMHWPYSQDAREITIEDTWHAMEKLLETKKVRFIGVSNFSKTKLTELLKVAKIRPAVNQIELHPWLQQQELIDYCKDENIIVISYMPFGNLNKWNQQHLSEMMIDEPDLVEIARELGISVNQLCLSWAIQRGTCVIPKSVHKERIIHNFAFFPLNKIIMDKIMKLDRNQRFCDISDMVGENIFA